MKSLLGYGCKQYGQSVTYKPALSQKVAQVLSAIPPNKTKHIPGISVGVIKLSDFPHHFEFGQASAGVRSSSPSTVPTPVTAKDSFHLGSCTKSFVNVLLNELQLLEPQFADIWNLPLGAALVNLPEEWKNITIECLMAHRAGIDDHIFLHHIEGATQRTAFVFKQIFGGTYPVVTQLWKEFREEEDLLEGVPFEERIKTTRRKRLLDIMFKYKPVEHLKGGFAYSNVGVSLVTLVIEELMKRPFEHLMKDYVFEPLDLPSAGFGTPDQEFLHHTPQKDDLLVPSQPWGHYKGILKRKVICVPPWENTDGTPDIISGAGNIYLNMEDWLKFLGANISFARNTQRIPLWYPRDKPIYDSNPQVGYGGGWMITDRNIPFKDPTGVAKWQNRLVGLNEKWPDLPDFGEVFSADRMRLSHGGSTGLWYASCYVDIAAGVAVAVMTNAGNLSSFRINTELTTNILNTLKEEK